MSRFIVHKSCVYELKSNIFNKYFTTAITASYSYSSSVTFIAVHDGAFSSLRKGDYLKVEAHILIHKHFPTSHLTKVSVFFQTAFI
jgi:hypothetical protein